MRAMWLAVVVVCAACGGKDGDSSGGGGGGSGTTAKPASKLACADLPGAPRSSLRASTDGKTLYYVEQATRAVGDERVVSYNVHAYDVAAKTSRLLTADVSNDTVIAPDGTVIFRKPTTKLDFLGRRIHTLVVVAPGKAPVTIEPPKAQRDGDGNVTQFLFDPETSTIVFRSGDLSSGKIWKVPLAGGNPVELGKTFRMYAIQDRAVIHTGGMMKLIKQPLDGSAAKEIELKLGNLLVGFSRTHVMLESKYGKQLSIAPLGDIANAVKITLERDDITMERGSRHVVARKQREFAIHRFETDKLEPEVVIRGVEPSHVVDAGGGQLAMLATHDTDGDGATDATDESDLCFVPAKSEPVAVTPRTIPKRYTELAGKLAKVAKDQGLDNATVRFSVEGSNEVVELAAAGGPTDFDKLRALVKATQVKLTEVSGMPYLSVAIAIEGTGRRAVSRWDSRAAQFLVSAGMGTAQVVDRGQYQIEVDPKVSLAIESSRFNRNSEIGEATCSGTVKNVSNMQLVNLEAECSNVTFGRESKVKAKVVPATLPPKATGTYKIKLGVIDGSTATPLTIYGGGARLAYLNAFAVKRAEAILDVAVKVQEQTKLAYWTMYGATIGPSYSRKKVVKIVVRADKALAEGSDSARSDAAATALRLFRDYVATDKNLEGEPMILILRPIGFETAWTYTGGRLVEGEPRDPF